jgi:hypothetical protein
MNHTGLIIILTCHIPAADRTFGLDVEAADRSGRRLRALKGLTPYAFIDKQRTIEPGRSGRTCSMKCRDDTRIADANALPPLPFNPFRTSPFDRPVRAYPIGIPA